MRKSKKMIIAAIFLVVLIVTNSLLDFMLVPASITRVIIHELDKSSDYQCVFLGASHGAYGIDSNTVSRELGKKTLNLCIGGEYMQDSYYLLKRTFETNHPDTIVFDMDFEYLSNVPKNSLSGVSIYNQFPFSLTKMEYFKDKVMGMEFRAALFPWMDYRENFSGAWSNLKTKFTKSYRSYNPGSVKMNPYNIYMGKGFIFRVRHNHSEKLAHLTWDESKLDQDSLEYFKKMVDLCKEKNVKFIMITIPAPVEQLSYSADEYDEAFTYLNKLAEENGIPYYNFNLLKLDLFSRTIQDYNDYNGHMYGDTAEKFSTLLSDFLKGVDNNQVTLSDYFYDSVKDIPSTENQ